MESNRKICLISYRTNSFKKKQCRLNKSAKKYGIKDIVSYKEKDIEETKFYNKYKHILDQPRGAGYWLWCPFLIYKTLKNLNDGDILIYADAGTIFVNSPIPLLKLCLKENILLFTNSEPNIKWNKRECLIDMKCDSKEYFYAHQVPTGFQVYVNNKETRKFIKEWLYYCCQPKLIDDSTGPYPEYSLFIEHRHHQSILTNLAIRYDIPLYRDPSQGGNHLKPLKFRKRWEWLQPPYKYANIIDDKSDYPTTINHLRNANKFHLFLIKLHAIFPRWLKVLTKKK